MGIIVMVGIVVSMSTLPADFAGEGRRQGAALRRAVESGRIRMLPILIAVLVTVAGPIALELGGRRFLDLAAGPSRRRRISRIYRANSFPGSEHFEFF